MNNIEKYITDVNVLNIYQFGSRVYGTQTDKSDYDYILVCNEYFDTKDIDIHCYTVSQFKQLIANHEIYALECLFLPNRNVVKETVYFDFVLDKAKLRTSISTICSNSWVKGKKKLIVQGDYDLNLALKSVFHSLRILNYGIQIAITHEILSYAELNYILDDLKKLSEKYQYVDLWNAIEVKYKPLYNKLHSQFKLLCPLYKNEKNKQILIENLMSKYNIDNDNFKMELLQII